jgi:hypothetical protein
MTAILDVRIPATATELSPLRHDVATALADRSVADSDTDTVVSVVNELVTAAIGTSEGPLEVRVQLEDSTARASVSDISTDDRLAPAPAADHDLAFAMLDHLAGSWGMSYDSGHAFLWAELPVVRRRAGTLSFHDGDEGSPGTFLNPNARGHARMWRVR